MTEQSEERVAVGSYVDEDRAQDAAGSVRDAGIGDVTVEEVADGVWQVLVPQLEARRALDELQPEEQHGMQTHL